ncbi:MAG TPA: protein-disulfide reductase DsbD domain-containing protein [Pseudomonadales bacterium]|nr:protein-disulfide reductase DsbD domain-containing protein [Pseudomonadales bacterium]
MQRFPPADKVFRLSASWEGDTLSVRWYLLPGYYLYRHRLGFAAADATLGKPRLPEGEAKQDPYFGHVVIYRDELLVSIPVKKAGHNIQLEVRYQGCADAGYCYPPQKKVLNVEKLQ